MREFMGAVLRPLGSPQFPGVRACRAAALCQLDLAARPNSTLAMAYVDPGRGRQSDGSRGAARSTQVRRRTSEWGRSTPVDSPYSLHGVGVCWWGVGDPQLLPRGYIMTPPDPGNVRRRLLAVEFCLRHNITHMTSLSRLPSAYRLCNYATPVILKHRISHARLLLRTTIAMIYTRKLDCAAVFLLVDWM